MERPLNKRHHYYDINPIIEFGRKLLFRKFGSLATFNPKGTGATKRFVSSGSRNIVKSDCARVGAGCAGIETKLALDLASRWNRLRLIFIDEAVWYRFPV